MPDVNETRDFNALLKEHEGRQEEFSLRPIALLYFFRAFYSGLDDEMRKPFPDSDATQLWNAFNLWVKEQTAKWRSGIKDRGTEAVMAMVRIRPSGKAYQNSSV